MTSKNVSVNGPTPSLYDRVGGGPGVHGLVEQFYRTVLDDPVLIPLFGTGKATHVDHLTAWMVEVLGGPRRYTDELGGFPTLLAAHRGLKITDEQAQRFGALFLQAVDTTGIGQDPELRDSLAAYIQFGVGVAVQNSHAKTDADLHPCQVVPQWSEQTGQ